VKRRLVVVAWVGIGVLLTSCQRDSGGVVNKVLVDFGIREKPERYVSASDKVFQQLSTVAKSELARLNQEARNGEIKFQEQDGLRGKYYKEVLVYEDYHPLEAQPVSRSNEKETGYVGLIEYSYRIYQSERKASRVEAAAEPANVATGETGRATYRYTFGSDGVWNGEKGEKTRR